MNLWKFLDGNKTYIGMIIVLIGEAGKIIKPEYYDFWDKVVYYGSIIGAVGVGHRTIKRLKKE